MPPPEVTTRPTPSGEGTNLRLDAVVGRSVSVPVPTMALTGSTSHVRIEAAIDQGRGEARYVPLSGSREGRIGPTTLSLRPRVEGTTLVRFRFVDTRTGLLVPNTSPVTVEVNARSTATPRRPGPTGPTTTAPNTATPPSSTGRPPPVR